MEAVIVNAIDRLSKLTGEDFHGYRSEVYSVIADAIRAAPQAEQGKGQELKPCPFCGSPNVCTRDLRGAEPQGDITMIECQDCFSRTAPWRTKKDAIHIWNRRPAAPLEQAIREVAETGILPDGDHVNGSTQMWLNDLLAEGRKE